MENLLLLFGYLLYSIIGFSLTIAIIDSRVGWAKAIKIGFLSGIVDFLVKEIAVPNFHLPDGTHFITGIIFLTLICYSILKLKFSVSFGVSVFSYIIAALTEIPVLLVLLQILGKETLVAMSMNKVSVFFMGLLSMSPMLLGLIYVKVSKKNFINGQIVNNFYRL